MNGLKNGWVWLWGLELHWKVLIGMVAGAFYALALGDAAMNVAPLGDLFLRLLKMIIVPLVFFSITTGVIGIGDLRSLGRLGGKTFGYYLLTSLAAILIGLTLTNAIKPGEGVELGATEAAAFDPAVLRTPTGLGDIVMRMVPTNIVKAMAEGDVLAVIFFALLLGGVIAQSPVRVRDQVAPVFRALFEVMMMMTRLVLVLLPIGVFGLVAKAVAGSGAGLFTAVGWYVVTIACGLCLHLLVVLPVVLWVFTRKNPLDHLRAVGAAMLTAFSTSSSGATLPVTMERVKHGAGVSNKVTSFVLPLGATINMDGTALYECAGVLFIAQALGFELSYLQQLVIVITAFLASVGAAAIPSAGLVMIFIVLDAVGLGSHPQVPVIVGTMLAVDRPLDMFRTTVNVTSDTVGAVVVASSEGERVLSRSEPSDPDSK